MRQIELIPTEDLITEIMNRVECLVMAYKQIDEGNKPRIKTHWSNDSFYIELIGMADVIKYQLQEDFHGENS